MKISQPHPIGDPEELAALYTAGAMRPDEVADYEAHLATGCALCRTELKKLEPALDALLTGVDPVEPAPEIREALMAESEPSDPKEQVWRNWDSDPQTEDLFIQRSGEEAWETTGVEGVEIRRLFVDRAQNRMTAMIRMAPGSWYPGHLHDEAEECLVLAGDLRVGDEVLRAGDYQRAASGSRHGVQSTETGCTLLIVSSLTDEID